MITAKGSPALTATPSEIGSSAILPALWAVISFSIFIASMMQISAPSSTSAPCSTRTLKTLPCSGEVVTRDYKVEVSGKLFDVKVIGEAVAGGAAPAAGGRKPPKRERKAGAGGGASSTALVAPLQGTVFKVNVEQGAEVAEGDLICVIEAMKMENEIAAHRSGKVTSLNVAVGAAVSSGDTLAVIE